MKSFRRFAANLAGTVTAALMLAACSTSAQQGPSQDRTSASAPPVSSFAAPIKTSPTGTSSPLGTTQAVTTPTVEASALTTPAPAPSTASARPTQANVTGSPLQGSGQGLAGSQISPEVSTEDPTVVQAFTQYAEYIRQNLVKTWSSWFQARGLPPTDVAIVIVPKGVKYTTQCHEPGQGPQTVTDEGSASYCHIDQTNDGRTGIVWLPLTSMIGIVNGNVYGKGQSQWPGDFAFAETIGHEFGHHVEATMVDWYTANQPNAGVKGPLGAWNELLADCFAGNWTESVYTQGILKQGEYAEAIAKIGLTGDSFSYDSNGAIVFDPSGDHGAPNHRVGAYKIGVEGVPAYNFKPGDPQTCMSYYWHADKEYTHEMLLPAG